MKEGKGFTAMITFTMYNTLLAIVPGVCAFILFLSSHLILWQTSFIQKKGVILLTKLSFVSYLLVYFLFIFFDFTLFIIPEHYWLSLPFYLFLVMLYFHFYVGFDRSVSIRLLGELAKSPKGGMKMKEIQERYSLARMLKPRLDMMVSHHWLKKKNGFYECTKKGALLARLTLFVQTLYHLDNTG